MHAALTLSHSPTSFLYGPHGLLYVPSCQGFAISLIAGLAAFAYDNKHKAMLNSALLIHHLTIVVRVLSPMDWNVLHEAASPRVHLTLHALSCLLCLRRSSC